MLGNGSIKPEEKKIIQQQYFLICLTWNFLLKLVCTVKFILQNMEELDDFFPLFFLNCFSIVWLLFFLQDTRNC